MAREAEKVAVDMENWRLEQAAEGVVGLRLVGLNPAPHDLAGLVRHAIPPDQLPAVRRVVGLVEVEIPVGVEHVATAGRTRHAEGSHPVLVVPDPLPVPALTLVPHEAERLTVLVLFPCCPYRHPCLHLHRQRRLAPRAVRTDVAFPERALSVEALTLLPLLVVLIPINQDQRSSRGQKLPQ